ncbi:MAG: sn-glycerol-3-phosphate ABC transporter ATP-binding protein UgpC [Clostridiales bacterium]|nr:sn-glycerol-3-phosphate ABC transporter ATP-binding protein UgpC [Clostridiales bacterium]
MSSLLLKNIYKVYPSGVTAVTDFNLDIEDKEFIVFVGPSGCGKSTTLRMIAGLEEITDGELYIDGVLMNDVEPKDRDIAMVFQNYALYPHMSIYDNMAFGLKLRKMPKEEIDARVQEAARILGLEMYLQRKPKALSGGQKQRVALGRAIVREPKVFLLDEPLSNLDAKLRAQMRTELTKLHHKLATTFIYVTHDQIEAMTMGTRIVVMKDGFMQQVDTPQNLYDYPINLFVAGFIGTPQMNFFDAKLTGAKDEVYVEFGDEKILLPKEKVELIYDLDKYLNTDKEIKLGIRPEDLSDDKRFVGKDGNPVIDVKVDVLEMLGAETLLYCKLKGDETDDVVDSTATMIAKVDARSESKMGENIKLSVSVAHCHLFDKETEMTIMAKDLEQKETYIASLKATDAE